MLSTLSAITLISSFLQGVSAAEHKNSSDLNYRLTTTAEILLTSEAGAKIAPQQNLTFQQGKPNGKVIEVRPDIVKQKIIGIGRSFTESSAYVLAHLDKDKRAEVMENIYGEKGANFS